MLKQDATVKMGRRLSRNKPEYLPVQNRKPAFGRKVNSNSAFDHSQVIVLRCVYILLKAIVEVGLKHIRKYIITLLIALVACTGLQAQLDTTLVLPEMQVLELRVNAIGTEKILFDKRQLEERSFFSLADFLNQESNIYVKSYGGNSLSSVSIQGASAAQTLILWNGLPIQSPTLGQLDLALIPNNFSEEVDIQLGGNSSSWGSGAIGGSINLKNEVDYNQNLELSYGASLGSYSNLIQQGKIQLGNAKFQSVSRVNYQRGMNDFIISPDPAVPDYRQSNAAFVQAGILQSFHYRPNANHDIAVFAWIQQSEKEIPPTITQKNSEAFQEDAFYRLMANWKYTKNKHQLKTSFGHFREKQNYEDPLIDLSALNKFQSLLAEFDYRLSIHPRHQLQLSSTTVLNTSDNEAYGKKQMQNRSAVLAAYSYQFKRLALQLSIREEWVNNEFLLPVPYMGWQQGIGQNFTFKLKVSREFRLPTLNDLYWIPGGNKDLMPESGWSQELGLNYSQEVDGHKWSLAHSFFNRNIRNWIMWAPSNQAFWEAQNINKVWSLGTMSKVGYSYTRAKFSVATDLNFNYTRSIFQEALRFPRIAVGDQLLYTPVFQGMANFRLNIVGFELRYQHQIVGQTQGANDEIPRFHVGNVHFSHPFDQGNLSGKIFLTINNIFNQNYVVVERRPMPGTNVLFGMHINFKNKKL